jgi:hypothetical protein
VRGADVPKAITTKAMAAVPMSSATMVTATLRPFTGGLDAREEMRTHISSVGSAAAARR